MGYAISTPPALTSISSKEAGGRRSPGGTELSSSLALSIPLHPFSLYISHSASILHLLLCAPLLKVGWGALGRGALCNQATNPLAFLLVQTKQLRRAAGAEPQPSPGEELQEPGWGHCTGSQQAEPLGCAA